LKYHQSVYLSDLKEAHRIANELDITQKSLDFPQYRGLTFKEFWEVLPMKLVYTNYEEELYQLLEVKNQRKVRVKKSGGLGITEFFARYVAWKCLKDDEWKNSQVDITAIIITGASFDLTKKIIGRIKSLFTGREFKSKESLVVLNGCKIEAFPTNHLEPSRGLNPRIVLLDEADFFPGRYQDEARTVAERYRIKGDAIIAMVSTPNLPGGLYERMDEEGDAKSGYITKEYNYEWGLGIVYDPEIIEREKLENPSFQREFNLQYGYGQGDVFDIPSLEKYSVEEYDLNYLGGQAGTYADPAWGSSKFGKITAEVRDNIIYVIECEENERASPSRMLDVMEESWNKHKQACKVDGANPGFIKDLKERDIPAVGVAFNELVPETEGSNTTTTLKKKLPINASMMLKRGVVRIHPEFKKLISQMRAVKFDKMGGIDKSEVPFDLVDAFDMMCWDLKYHDYSHFDVMENKIVRTNDEPERKKSKGISLNVEVVE
jgi:hypothetical protein